MAKPSFWGVVSPLPSPVLQMQAKMAEDAGLEGVFAAQVYGPPFIPLAAAAMVTERVRLASGIAIASVRSPFETAMAAVDLDRISGGRFTLGLGTSVRSWSEGIYGADYGKPLASLRETVEIVRMSIAKAHSGELTKYEGRYHHHDWSELQPPAPPLRTDIPVWIAALRGPLTSLAAEIGDGVLGHPIWSVEWCLETIPSWLERGLDNAGKERDEIEFNAWLFVAVNDDRRQAIEDARATVTFYGGVEQYEEFFVAHGFGKEVKHLQEGVKQGDYIGAAKHVTDEMAQTFVVCGTADEVRKRIAPMYEVVDSLTLVPPAYNLGADKLLSYSAAIAATFYA